MSTKSESALIVERVLDADPAQVFEALTNAEIMRRWFHPGQEGWSAAVQSDPKIGGTYQLDMRAPDGKVHPHSGKYVEFDPPRKVAFSWNTPHVQDSVVSIELRSEGAGTRLTLSHEFLPDKEIEGHRKGWSECLDNFGNTLAQ